MTRQWLSPPGLMCTSHLLGEHAETHSFLSKMHKGHSLEGFYEGHMFFGAEYIKARHDLLSLFIKGHGTPLDIEPELKTKYPYLAPTIDSVQASVLTLINRCEYCAYKHSQFSEQAS